MKEILWKDNFRFVPVTYVKFFVIVIRVSEEKYDTLL